jgi:alanine racemase
VIRSTVAHVDLAALQHNFKAIQSYVASRTPAGRRPPRVIAVVKANAYGHGARHVARALESAGARVLACADIEEGIALRQAGVEAEILVFGALSVSDLAGLFEYDLTPTCSTPGAGRALQATAAARNQRLRYHLKIDTGMNRLGFRHDNLEWTLPDLFESRNLELAAVYTHFATADDPRHPLFEQQRQRFDTALARVEGMGVAIPERHAANSAALLRDERTWFDMVRPGILLYGVLPGTSLKARPYGGPEGPPYNSHTDPSPDVGRVFRPAVGAGPSGPALDLRPVLSLKSRVVAVKNVRPGESVGYGGRFVADSPRTIATIPAGYADGLDTRLAGRGHVLVGGQRAPIVGAVSMDMLAIDATGIHVDPGDEAVFLGEQGGERIAAADMADAIGTIPYEVLCRIGSRIERVYDDGSRQ